MRRALPRRPVEELVLAVDTAFDLPGAERIEDRRDAVQEGVRLLVLLDAYVEPAESVCPDRFENGLPSPMGGLRTHQDPDLAEPLPFAVEGEQSADLEVSGRDVERLRDAGPLLQVPEPGPARDTVVDDEELAALGVNGHDAPCSCFASIFLMSAQDYPSAPSFCSYAVPWVEYVRFPCPRSPECCAFARRADLESVSPTYSRTDVMLSQVHRNSPPRVRDSPA